MVLKRLLHLLLLLLLLLLRLLSSSSASTDYLISAVYLFRHSWGLFYSFSSFLLTYLLTYLLSHGSFASRRVWWVPEACLENESPQVMQNQSITMPYLLLLIFLLLFLSLSLSLCTRLYSTPAFCSFSLSAFHVSWGLYSHTYSISSVMQIKSPSLFYLCFTVCCLDSIIFTCFAFFLHLPVIWRWPCDPSRFSLASVSKM